MFLFVFSILSRRCPLLATFLSVLFCLLSLLISDSRFDLVWFRLSCDHDWIHSGSVYVRKTTTTVRQETDLMKSVLLTARCIDGLDTPICRLLCLMLMERLLLWRSKRTCSSRENSPLRSRTTSTFGKSICSLLLVQVLPSNHQITVQYYDGL